jgi:hypothetical protein
MGSLPTWRRWRFSAALAAALYALVMLASAFEHHDLLCHLRNPDHCTACSVAQLGSDPETPATPRAAELPDAGRALTFHVIASGTLLTVRTTGRSPPFVA